MKLDIHLQQSKLVYLIRDEENINIKENDHYFFLCFGDVVQSIMLKRKPYRLTLPHQYFITLPLLFVKPSNVIELGLGGGNILRFIKNLLPQCQWLSLERNLQVALCFQQYFNPQQLTNVFELQDAKHWISNQTTLNIDWLIVDIYQNNQNDLQSLTLINQLLDKLAPYAWLSINLVDLAEKSLNKVLGYLSKLKQDRQMSYFIVPQYRNIIVHIHPKLGQPNRAHSCLPAHQFNRWQTLWHQGRTLN